MMAAIDGNESALQYLINSLKISAGWDLEANKMAGRLEHMRMAKKTTKSTQEYVAKFGSMLQSDVYKFLSKYSTMIDHVCATYRNSPDYEFLTSRGYLSAKRFYDTYVLRTYDNSCYETPIQMFVRMSVFFTCQVLKHRYLLRALTAIQLDSWGVDTCTEEEIFYYFFETISSLLVCCATPIMRSAGVEGQSLASCFILAKDMSSDENTLSTLAGDLLPLLQSQSGVGMDVTSFSDSGKNIISCLKLINAQVEFFNDRNIRPVSVAAYMELWHYHVEEFLNAKLPENPERCSSIFQGLCIPSLFFKLYEKDPTTHWYLFKPDVGAKLRVSYGVKFEEEYQRLVQEKQYVRAISVKSLMFMIVNTIIKTGSPYILLKESLNENHWRETQGQAINCANLCAEIVQESVNGTAVCNLANICLPKCLTCLSPITADYGQNNRDLKLSALSPDYIFSDKKLAMGIQAAVFMVNCSIMGGILPTASATQKQVERSMGIGVQGLADVFAYMNMCYDDPRSERLEVSIFEQLYYHAVDTSNKIVSLGECLPFHGFKESKLAQGVFHWENWNLSSHHLHLGEWAWDNLRKRVQKHGTFNSQFVALMPTVGTSQLTGYSEAFYPFYANISSRVSNKEEIVRSNITFLEHIKPEDIALLRKYGGNVTQIPEPLQSIYRPFLTAFDINPEIQIARASARAPFIDQSQSFSFFLKEQNVKNASYLKNLLMLGYKYKLKTLMYYCRIQKQSNLTAYECLDTESDITPKSSEKTGDGFYKKEDMSHNVCVNSDSSDCVACQ
ncbi:ORF61 [Felid gammaherpesvirus 1]|uniref:Ribonucleoside-diphosphate reductase n=1 Tax=Felid gammaherpesvirus 1 TaxID=2560468 RepID=A0A0M3T9D4_9GAMA|nr:ORF61 [Felis catus gammaherpesvirus 1]ALE14776.1 ORF61 [Felis catus gammaherpesvirus 1]